MHGRGGRGEAKLVRCANGAVHDVLVDIRRDSPTFGRHEAFLLDDSEFRHLYVPPGFLHGFQALSAMPMCAIGSIDRMTRPRTWPSPTTTLTWQ